MKLGNRRLEFEYKLDTWGSDKNHDKLLTNVVRLTALASLAFLSSNQPTLLRYTFFVYGIIFVGITNIRFYRNKMKKIEINLW